MKIIHTMPDIDKEASGPSYSVIRLCESLRNLGNDSIVALTGSQQVDKSYIQAFQCGAGPARLGRSPQMHQWLKKQVASATVEIIHNHSLWMMPNVYPGWATKGRRIPYVVSPRGTLSEWAMASGSKIKQVFWPLLQKPSIEHSALFHATSESEYQDIRRMGFKQPIAIIPNGIDLPVYQVKPQRTRRKLLYLGRLHPVKGIDSLLTAWLELQSQYPDWDLLIVGPTNTVHAQELMKKAVRLGLSRYEFVGPIYGKAKFDAYREADLYVLPSYSENFGMTVAEALACSTPAVVSQGAPWKGLETKNAGWWPTIGQLPLQDTLRIAMSKSQVELDAMGENGRYWMQNDFSWTQIGYNMQTVYEWLLARGEKPSYVSTD